MAMADMASRSDGKPMTLAEIAKQQDISLSYLEQLFAMLRRGGLVKSVRGPGGGYIFARPIDDIRVSDVIAAVDERITAVRCEPGASKGCMPCGARCITHDLWEELSNHIHLFLSSVTLADVVNRKVLGRSGYLMQGGLPHPRQKVMASD